MVSLPSWVVKRGLPLDGTERTKQMSANSPNRRFRLKRDPLAAEDQLMKTIDNMSRGRRDRGNTMLELLVAIVLMGFAVSAVIGGSFSTSGLR